MGQMRSRFENLAIVGCDLAARSLAADGEILREVLIEDVYKHGILFSVLRRVEGNTLPIVNLCYRPLDRMI
jgi:hypothetical protein